MSKKEFFLDKVYDVVKDDLKYDGKNLIIPSYWVQSMCDFISQYEENAVKSGVDSSDPDFQDFKFFQSFLFEVAQNKKINQL